jgi:insulysin
MSKIHENSNSIERFDNITKSSHDKRQYRGILLNNQLKCLLISDPFKIISAASIDVYVGSMLEPKDLPGLAHFCEQ